MSTAFICEYARVTDRDAAVAQEPPITVQKVTYTTSTQSSAFNSETRFVRIICDAKAHFAFGKDPTATADYPYVTADLPEYFGVARGHKVAFYDGSS